jgi:hypothetical protein
VLSDLSALEGALSAQTLHLPGESPEFLENEVRMLMSAVWALHPRRADDYHTWVSVCAAFKGASRHDLRASLHEFKRWSKQSRKYDEQACIDLWQNLDGAPPDKVLRMAREDGWVPDNVKPEILVTANENRVLQDAIAALARIENVYQRGNCLARVTTSAPVPRLIERDPDAPRIELLTRPAIRDCLSRAATFKRELKDGTKVIHVPEWLPAAVESADGYHNPPIEGVSELPFLRSDGTVCREPGLDRDTAIHFAPSIDFPRVDDAGKARDALLDLVQDFPFQDDAHKAAWIAAVLTPVARPAYRGGSPLIVVDANTPGTGKGLLLDVAAQISTGRPMAVTSAPENDAEMRKRLTSLMIAGEPLCCFDNVASKIAFPSLDAALTGEVWRDRVLGGNKTVTLPNRVTFYATGNNIALHRDTFRRTNYVRLESKVENPETRSGFKYPNLLDHVRKNRGHYTACALAILQGYFRDRRPNMGLPPLGSFEGWSDLVRSAVVWCGLPDPMNTRVALAESDDDTALLRQLLAGWREASPGGMTSAEAIEHAHAIKESDGAVTYKFPTLRAAIDEVGGSNPRHALGLKLRNYKGRVVDGYYFSKIGSFWKAEVA